MTAREDAAAERTKSAGTLDDPRLAYEASNLPAGNFNFGSTPLSGHQLGLRQRLPFPGRLRNERQAAEAAHSARSSDTLDAGIRIAAQVEDRWARLGFAQRSLEITERNLEILRQLADISEVKYRVGAGLQQDVLRAQVAVTRLLQDRLRRASAVTEAEASLAALLDLAAGQALPRTLDLEVRSELPELERLFGALDRANPRLDAARMEISRAEHDLDATRLASLPDVDLGVGYRVRRNAPGDPVHGDDFVSLGFTIRLPVDRKKWNSRVAERGADVRRTEAAHRRTRADLRADLRALHAELERAVREFELLDTGLVPQARQSLDSSRSGYEVGRVDFLSLLDSQIRLLDAELQRERARADVRSAYALLEATLGEKIR